MSKYSFGFLLAVLLFIFLNIVFPVTGYNQPNDLSRLTKTIVLKGTIITPGKILRGGFLVIRNNKIDALYETLKPDQIPNNAIYIDTRGIIFPGLVDLHNHISYNVFPDWEPGKDKFSNRYEWRFHSRAHQRLVKTPDSLMSDLFCARNTYGELRGLVGGTTSMANTALSDCLARMVRNLDDPVQVEGRSIKYLLDIKNHNLNKPEADLKILADVDNIRDELIAGSLDAFLIHLAEGKSNDQVSKDEFGLLLSSGLLTNKTAIIHGIALTQDEYKIMKYLGASLIWSPRSNLQLYGQTANVILAKNEGIRIALAPDWAITGSNNILEELQFAAGWNKNYLGGFFTDRQLVDMITRNPAEIAGLGDKLGSIREGFYADLLIISGDSTEPYRSLIQSSVHNVKLVFVNGAPLYGTKDLMEKFWENDELEKILDSNPPMMLKLPLPPSSESSFKALKQSLSAKMLSLGTSLAPLFPPGRTKPNIEISPAPDYNKPGIKNKKY